MWKLTITYTVPGQSRPDTVTRTSEAGFNWEHIDAGNGLWQFADNAGDWTAAYSRVLWFTEENVEDQVENGQVAENGQDGEKVKGYDETPIALRQQSYDDGYEGGF